jgi:SAM-dependent methyltransferase
MSDHEIDIRWPSLDYAGARPDYPDEMFEYLDSLCFAHGLAWDCATGTGQAAIPLAGRFGAVVATDSDHGQLSQARAHPRVYYAHARAERAPLPEGSVDLVSVAQALHWFDLPAFFTEAGRALRPGGLLAAWCYYHGGEDPQSME